MSQLLRRLESSLATCSDPIERAELSARRACLLARRGEIEAAKAAVVDLRGSFGDGRSGRTTVWIMLAEALIHWYGDLNPQALDRIARAQLLSNAMQYRTMIALAAAWKAHIEFDMSNFDSMFKSLGVAAANMDDSNLDASGRVAIVLFNAFALCGDRAQSQLWFMKGRDIAVKAGDQTSIEALQFNRTALGLSVARAEHCVETLGSDAIRCIRSEYESARNLQALTGVDALKSHLHLCDQRLLMLESRFQEAKEAISVVRGEGPFGGSHFSQCLADLELAYCQFHTGAREAAFDLFSTIDTSSFLDLDIDDQLMAAWMQHEMVQADPRFGDLAIARNRLAEMRGAYVNSRESLRAGLQAFLADAPLGLA